MRRVDPDNPSSIRSLARLAGNLNNKPAARNNHTAQPEAEPTLNRFALKPLALSIDQGTTFPAGDFRDTLPRFAQDARAANRALVDVLARVAERKDATAAQIAIAWLLAQVPQIVPIPGTRKVERLEENLGAARIELGPDDLAEIERESSAITVQGGEKTVPHILDAPPEFADAYANEDSSRVEN